MKYLDALVNRRQGFVLLDVFVKVGILDERIHELDGLQRFLEVPRRVEDAEFYRADFLDGNAVEPIADMPAVGAIAENLEEVFERVGRKRALHYVRGGSRRKILGVPPFRKVENLLHRNCGIVRQSEQTFNHVQIEVFDVEMSIEALIPHEVATSVTERLDEVPKLGEVFFGVVIRAGVDFTAVLP